MFKNVACVNIFLFSFFSLIVPISIANKIFFILILGILILNVFSGKRFPKLLAPIIFISIYALGFVLSFTSASDTRLAIQFFMSTFILLFIYYIYIYNVDFERVLFSCLIFLASFTIVFSILNTFELLPDYFNFIFKEYSLGENSVRELAGVVVPMIHFGSAPILFLAVVIGSGHMLKRGGNFKDLSLLLFFLTAIALSSSRANIILSVIYIIVIFFIKSGWVFKFISSLIILYACNIGWQFILMNFSSVDGSNFVKIGHFLGFVEQFSWTHLVLGDGLASYYFSPGLNKLVSHTEITILDQIRYFGVVSVVILYGSLVVPGILLAFKLKDFNYNMKLIGFIMYLIMSLTNPVLFNSFGNLVILWWWYIYLKARGDYKNA